MTDTSTWIVQVPVATVWTSPDSPREMDVPGISNPLQLDTWLKRLTYEPRLALCEENLVQSQLLFGEEVLVKEEQENWLHILIPSQPSKKNKNGYPGWIPKAQVKPIRTKDWRGNGTAVVTVKTAPLLDENRQLLFRLSYLTVLPVLAEGGDAVRVQLPEGTGYLAKQDIALYGAGAQITRKSGTAIAKAGERFIGLPYFWGGMSGFGYDCSGFSYNMHKANGYQIPRDASDQAVMGGKAVPLNELQPGDLLFFAYQEGKGQLHHVGIYYGNGQMIHAPSTGKGIEVITIAGTVYEKELCSARRYWQEEEE